MTFRIAQISDTHLGRAKPHFVPSFRKVVEHVNALDPDLVVNSGDMSLDGAGDEQDLAEARRLHAGIAAPLRFLPGNHDLGEGRDAPVPAGHPVIAAERRERYCRHFGADFWCEDAGGWRILAINALLLGSGLAAAAAQLRFVAEAASTVGSRPLALFLHKPLFDLSCEEDVIGGRFVNPAARRELFAALGDAAPALVASGHVHQFRALEKDGAHHVWAPSTAFIFPDAMQPRYGVKELGYVEHVLEPDGVHASRFVAVPGVVTCDILDHRDAYAQYLGHQPAAERGREP